MSATNRGAVRAQNDFYPTKAKYVVPILKRLEDRFLYGCEHWLEPCAGDGSIVRAVNEFAVANHATPPAWSAVEIDPGMCDMFYHRNDFRAVCGDFLRHIPDVQPHVIITNPPYLLAQPIIEHSLDLSELVLMLLRVNFVGSKKRSQWWRNMPVRPNIYVLDERPSFTDDGKTDATEYAWFVWDQRAPEFNRGRWDVLEVK